MIRTQASNDAGNNALCSQRAKRASFAITERCCLRGGLQIVLAVLVSQAASACSALAPHAREVASSDSNANAREKKQAHDDGGRGTARRGEPASLQTQVLTQLSPRAAADSRETLASWLGRVLVFSRFTDSLVPETICIHVGVTEPEHCRVTKGSGAGRQAVSGRCSFDWSPSKTYLSISCTQVTTDDQRVDGGPDVPGVPCLERPQIAGILTGEPIDGTKTEFRGRAGALFDRLDIRELCPLAQ